MFFYLYWFIVAFTLLSFIIMSFYYIFNDDRIKAIINKRLKEIEKGLIYNLKQYNKNELKLTLISKGLLVNDITMYPVHNKREVENDILNLKSVNGWKISSYDKNIVIFQKFIYTFALIIK